MLTLLYDPPKNIEVIETNTALRRHCITQGWDSIDHGNIAFRHLDHGSMHPISDGNCLFAKNINAHLISGNPVSG